MQKTLIIAAICLATAFATAGTQTAPVAACVGTGDGKATVKGVCQVCDPTCKTCSGALATNCLSCYQADTLQTDKSCGCDGTTKASVVATSTGSTIGTMTCPATADTNTVVAFCQRVPGFSISATANVCGRCHASCKDCTTGVAAANCASDVAEVVGTTLGVTGCWGGSNMARTTGEAVCTYSISKAYIRGSTSAFTQAVATGASAAIGYFYTNATTDTFTYTRCVAGCKTCTTATDCTACAANYTLTGAACACSGAFFVEAATATADEKCTACGTGALTCDSATVAKTCDTSYTLTTSSVTATNMLCVLNSVSSTSTDSSASSTDGESSATTTSATDAASTSGVLITAASMLLAVILA